MAPDVPGIPRMRLPPLKSEERGDPSQPPKKDSSDKISRTEFDLAVAFAHAEGKTAELERRVDAVETDVKDFGMRIVELKSEQGTIKAAKEARHGLRLAIIGGVCTVLAGSGIVSAKACTSFRDELRTKSASVASGEVQRQQLSAEQIRQNTINEQRPIIIKETLDAIDQRNKDLGLVTVPNSMVVKGKTKQ